jgi:hypothetical protein
MGYCFSLGGALFSWCAQKQKTVSISSTEAEYIAISETCCESLWLCQLLCELNLLGTLPTSLLCDNNGAMVLANNPTNHARSKHIDVCYHFIRERVEDNTISIF